MLKRKLDGEITQLVEVGSLDAAGQKRRCVRVEWRRGGVKRKFDGKIWHRLRSALSIASGHTLGRCVLVEVAGEEVLKRKLVRDITVEVGSARSRVHNRGDVCVWRWRERRCQAQPR